jgi:uncharacterized protein YjbI with pentapeptide repeats
MNLMNEFNEENEYVDLHGYDFREVNLKNMSFVGSNLESALFQGANLQGANFQGANLNYREHLCNVRILKMQV